MNSNPETSNSRKHQPITGIILVAVGAILLAGNLGMIPSGVWNIIFRWPSIFAVLAIINLVKKSYIPALGFGALWGFFVLPDIIPSLDSGELWKFWPIILIFAGITFLNSHEKKSKSFKGTPRNVNSDEIIEEVAVFGGNVKRFESTNFKGGEITSIFGGTELYFNNSKIAPGGAVIELTNIFGGTKLIVPRDWNVRVEIVSILGGFADKRVYLNDESPSNQTLTIKGVTIFGGGELINY